LRPQIARSRARGRRAKTLGRRRQLSRENRGRPRNSTPRGTIRQHPVVCFGRENDKVIGEVARPIPPRRTGQLEQLRMQYRRKRNGQKFIFSGCSPTRRKVNGHRASRGPQTSTSRMRAISSKSTYLQAERIGVVWTTSRRFRRRATRTFTVTRPKAHRVTAPAWLEFLTAQSTRAGSTWSRARRRAARPNA